MDQLNIKDIAELSKSFAEFTKRLSNEFGLFTAPRHIKRITDAENRANLARAESEIKIADLHARAKRRLEVENLLHQQNLEIIIGLAQPEIKDDAKPDQVESDWLSRFIGDARHVSDPEMQTLWAKILAGEVNSPGSYSKRTVNFLSELSKDEAQLFTKLCGFCVDYLTGRQEPLVLSYRNEIYTSHLAYQDLMHLRNIGLIDFDTRGFVIHDVAPRTFWLSYFGDQIRVTIPKNVDDFRTGMVRLTQIGTELQRIAGAQPVEGFLDYITKKFGDYRIMIQNYNRSEFRVLDSE